MHTRTYLVAAAAAASMALSACSGSQQPASDGGAPTHDTATSTQACLPVPGTALVVLDDDLQAQNADNIIPALNSAIATDSVLTTLAAVSEALTTEDLIALNQAVDIDRRTSEEAAQTWWASAALGIPASGDGSSLTIGAANFSESITLANIYADALEAAGYSVTVRQIGNRETYVPALSRGEIDIVPEYAATLTEYLEGDVTTAVASGDIDETVAALTPLANDAGLTVGKPAAAQNQNAFAVTQGFVEAYGVTSLSELAATCGAVVLGGPAECPERPFCQPTLEDVYGVEVAQFRALDAGGPLTKNAITTGEVTIGLVFSSDGALATH